MAKKTSEGEFIPATHPLPFPFPPQIIPSRSVTKEDLPGRFADEDFSEWSVRFTKKGWTLLGYENISPDSETMAWTPYMLFMKNEDYAEIVGIASKLQTVSQKEARKCYRYCCKTRVISFDLAFPGVRPTDAERRQLNLNWNGSPAEAKK